MNDTQLANVKIMIGLPIYGQMPYRTHRSLLMTYKDAWGSGLQVGEGTVYGSSVITKARNDVVDCFLQSDCTHLFWIDGDMEWTPKDFGSIVALCARTDMHIVGTTYPSKTDPVQYFIKVPDGPIPVNEYGCLEVHGFGLGFCCMTRESVQAIADSKPWVYDQINNRVVRDIFRIGTTPVDVVGSADLPGCPPELYGKPLVASMGEDMAFFEDLRNLGYKVWLYPGLNLGHIGQKVYTGDLMKAMGMERYGDVS